MPTAFFKNREAPFALFRTSYVSSEFFLGILDLEVKTSLQMSPKKQKYGRILFRKITLAFTFPWPPWSSVFPNCNGYWAWPTDWLWLMESGQTRQCTN